MLYKSSLRYNVGVGVKNSLKIGFPVSQFNMKETGSVIRLHRNKMFEKKTFSLSIIEINEENKRV